ncbi:MAG TPA: methyltransferase domain-containing protein [Ignavibacteriales bacterium]|nr:methyltransferase domain-containing protein [Ignavibacteriales bacterium]
MEEEHEQVCPWWAGYLLLFPLRKLFQDPEKITAPYLKPGMKVLDFGSAMGFFSLPMARLVGPQGRVYCADIQQKMLDKLTKRAEKAGLKNIEPRLIYDGSGLDNLAGQIDFCLLFAVVHEVPDRDELFALISRVLKSNGKVLFAEPAGHVSEKNFNDSIKAAARHGLKVSAAQDIDKSRTVLLKKI